MIPVIMAGGSGTRLWPLSRTQYPKQFLPLHSDFSMLQETVSRLGDVNQVNLICNEEHRFLAAEQMRVMNQSCSIFLEPVGRNTAPAIALAALQAVSKGQGDECLLVLAADHVIEDEAAFRGVVAQAEPLATDGYLVTFGIVPNQPETGYGYIKADMSGALEDQASKAYSVAAFVEKPDLATAESYLAEGGYYWNSGMFMFRADRYLEELGKYRPDILAACEKAMQATIADMDFVRVDAAAFEACPDESVDYAVMEKTDRAVVLPLDAGWSDVGSWAALWEIKDKDSSGNVLDGDVIAHNTRDSFVMSSNRLVTTLGVDNLIIVDTPDALLVADKDKIQDVKAIVAEIKNADRNETFQHREVYRPWGKYDSIDLGDRYQVKRITVKPGARLSVQKHHHRAEHWIVVSGTANVTKGNETFLVTENQSTYIPLGEIHCLENPGKVELELIEIQSGSYLGEDDIVRLEDQYGRA
ncbi:mannose-1-phosphate guanylyltransferase/mannose-6-phosphate isomerase [Amphritea sp. 2_MG-2023]|uniref:mannose-1-phosphate guanylyltransferase/mannose-6-phosphate isomerase n=1 Tax=Amphritea TaxID=515417 RepID=UPI001C06CE7C|nr:MULTISPECIES: mannose-1-phosphate guanylyltransferase/mannose-6-phosphate isomerase [Amphritea]MBU2964344.1 mannose-1-phosphate guanylyltransferase/mannose-6-phosphate isomerase [Amphritea atlantica]MDO6419696.1 mannose-1-phosphate guanylyltransferase/mannose-6-phosphate isomerase [Amphritea sp. 2_MG-2023]